MRPIQMLMMSLLGLSFAFSGCARITTQVVEKPRVDQELAAGNRGYLAGSAPPASDRKATRTMIQSDIELPTAQELNPWKKKAAASAAPAPAPAPVEPDAGVWQPPAQEEWEPAAPEPSGMGEAYTVQKGDTLQKIAKKFYGSSLKWKRIYDANRDVLKSPDRVYPGQELTIPPADGSAQESGESSQYK